ncbi:fatty acid desaturase family protein [Tropicimonas marinistellae]|uniref:fatty acid desaturase family protein n=1 Tax=Tropicimonas marinistellae TaxID=1739787 RepID=UPI001372ED76|nr:fatty acid desaturase [Tropicimonas marinistellae]
MRRFVGLSRYSRLKAWGVVGWYVALIVAGIALGHHLLSLPTSWLTVLAMVSLAFFIGTRLRGLNNIVHECSHSTFSAHKADNVVLGKLCSAILTGCFRQYKDDHLSHHAHLGDYEHDHEFAAIEKFRLHEPLTPMKTLKLALAPLLGQHLRMYSGINMSGDDGKFFFALKIGLLLAIMAFSIVAPLTSLFFVVIPLFYVFPTLNFWTDCLDHAGLVGSDDELTASRNILAPTPIRLLFFPRYDCYHLVHHLFPQVPASHLKSVHDELCEEPAYRNQPTAARPAHFALPELFSGGNRNRVGMQAEN